MDKDSSIIVINYEGNDYYIGYDGTEAEAKEWFLDYASKVKKCEVCGCVFLPGEPVGLISGAFKAYSTDENLEKKSNTVRGYVHADDRCAGSGHQIGYYDKSGKLINLFPSGDSIISECFRTGQIIVMNNNPEDQV